MSKLISYVKIIGPPYEESIHMLERISLDMPEVCIMNTILLHGNPVLDSLDWIYNYMKNWGDVKYEECDRIISDSGHSLGDYDFYFEWFQEPSMEQLNKLTGKIDDALNETGARYTITHKKK